jgi:hypothetical protein
VRGNPQSFPFDRILSPMSGVPSSHRETTLAIFPVPS